MTFVHPLVFILIIPLSALIYPLVKPMQKGRNPLFSKEVFDRLCLVEGKRKMVRLFFLWLSGCLMITALARPVLPPEHSTLMQEGYDIMIGLDLSHSMSATDISPSRLEVAKEKISQLVKAYPRHRFGIIGFSTHPFVIAPMTRDTETLLYLLDSLQPQTLMAKGTDLSRAIALASKLSKSSYRILILFTDGGDNETYKEEIDIALKENIRLYPIATGTPQGSTLLDEENQTIKDAQGRVVLSTIHPDIEELASKTGGVCRFISQGSEDIQSVMEHITTHLEPHTKRQEDMFNKREFFLYPLCGAIITLFIALFRVKIPPILVLFLFIVPKSDAAIFDFYEIKQGTTSYKIGHYEQAIAAFESLVSSHPTPEKLYNLGNAYYKSKRYTKAIATYEKIVSSDPIFLSLVEHNLANAYAMQENYDKAKIFYKRSLAHHFHEHTQKNLLAIDRLSSLQEAQMTKNKSSSKDKKESTLPSSSTQGKSSYEMSTDTSSQGSASLSKKQEKDERILGELSQKKPPSSHQFIPTSSKGVTHEKPW